MTSIKFYVLTNKNIHALKRHERTIPKKDLFIVINSKDDFYVNEAKEYCETSGIEYAITTSDGTAATGKNSVLDTFLASSFDYAVMIDGDDYLTSHGVCTYKLLVDQHSFDALALECQYGLVASGMSSPEAFDPNLRTKLNPDAIGAAGMRAFYKPRDFWETTEWGKFCAKYISTRENHLRVVVFSKKAAGMFRFDPKFVVGEDTLMYLNYKQAHVSKQLILRHYFDEFPTYVYDTRLGGVSLIGTTEWLSMLVKEYKRRESIGLMPDAFIRRIEAKYPEDYIMDLGMLPDLDLPEPRWGDAMNEEYVKKIVDVITNQRNHAHSVIAELEAQLFLLNNEVNSLKYQLEQLKEKQE